jgi:sulfite reductase (ferredoxin)
MAGSPVETIKINSRGLRGTIQETIENPEATHFSEDDYQLLKFHGSYQQDDRDQRAKLKQEGKDKAWMFMLRTKTPGGSLTAKQYLDLDKLADDVANGTLRITTRQGIQFHGVLKVNFKECVARVNKSGITTIGACGDVVRNTLACAIPFQKEPFIEAQRLAKELSDKFLFKSKAYTDIWIDSKPLNPNPVIEEEPIYGKYYLPRKFKIAIAIPPYNDMDVYTNDLGFIAHAPNGVTEGYTVVVGGGMGMSHGQTKTYPVLARPLFYIKKEHAVQAAIGVVIAQRDHGNREDRKLARLKYVIENKGIEWFKKEVLARVNIPTEEPKPVHFDSVADVLGWHDQGNGKWFCGVWVDDGRIKDGKDVKYRSAFREIAQKFNFPMRFTANCNLYFYDVNPDQKAGVDEILKKHSVPHTDGFTEARKTSQACVSLPTCGLGLAESERVFSGVMDKIDEVLRELKLEKEPILFRMTGCPNGCARPYNADFAFVGRAPSKYAFYVGGSIYGDRLAGMEKKVIETKDIPAVVRTYLEEFKAKRNNGETFTKYWGRTHQTGPLPIPEQFHVELAEREKRLAGTKVEAPVE